MRTITIRGKQYSIVASNKARSIAHLYKVVLSLGFIKIIAQKPPNEFVQSQYTRERASLLRQIEWYEKDVTYLSPPISAEFEEERDYWLKPKLNVLDALKQDLILLDYKKELNIIK